MVFVLTGIASAATPDVPPYYRFWRGFKKDGLAWIEFHRALVNDFMPATVKTHGSEGLMSYMVVLPPRGDSRFIPDEIALVTYGSEQTYKTITNTPHGKAYQVKHGEIFSTRTPGHAEPLNKGLESRISRSLVPVDFSGITAKGFHSERAYDVLSKPVDWQKGHSVCFFGLRKKSLRPDFFWDTLYKHIIYTRTAFSPLGLKGYVILVSPDYEIAFMNWESKSAMENALQSQKGKALVRDSRGILDTILWQDFRDFDGNINPGECVNCKFSHP